MHKYDYIRGSDYQIPPPPRPFKPDASKTTLPDAVVSDNNDNDDVFFAGGSIDRFGTMRASDAIARKKLGAGMETDYRKVRFPFELATIFLLRFSRVTKLHHL